MSLERLLRAGYLEALADERTLARAAAYVAQNRVLLLRARERNALHAEVVGRLIYEVQVVLSGEGGLGFACTCPCGRGGQLCAHVVAGALTWRRNAEGVGRAPDAPANESEQVDNYLATLDGDALRALLARVAAYDEVLHDTLVTFRNASEAPGLPGLQSVVSELTTPSGVLDWREADKYAQGLLLLCVRLESEIGACGGGLITLVEGAIALVEQACSRIDVSNGKVHLALTELQQVHRRACEALLPDPAQLGTRLVEVLERGPGYTFAEVLPEYLRVLGEHGLAAYRTALTVVQCSTPAASLTVDELSARASRLAAAAKQLSAVDTYAKAMARVGPSRGE